MKGGVSGHKTSIDISINKNNKKTVKNGKIKAGRNLGDVYIEKDRGQLTLCTTPLAAVDRSPV